MNYQGGTTLVTQLQFIHNGVMMGFSMDDGVRVGVVGSQNLLNLGNSSVVVHPQLR
jgi:hypothetical protein